MDKKSENRKKKKPLHRAGRWAGGMARMVPRLLALLVGVIVTGLIFSSLQAIGAVWVRIAISAALCAGVLVMCAGDGMTCGARDAAASRRYDSLVERGLSVSAREDAACYHPMKAIGAAVLVFAIPFVLSIYLAATTTGYTYTLQDLPLWVTQSYGMRADVMGPLGAYTQRVAIEAADWIRMVVRVPMMMFVNLFPDPLKMSGLVDRLSPLCICSYPLAFVAGYLYGPAMNRRLEKENRRAKKLAARRAQKKGLAAELTGSQMQVHYGHKAQSASHKKKELV